MYCVKCGVRLQDGVTACPLCQTPVWNPDRENRAEKKNYPDTLPVHYRESRLPALVALTMICAIAVVVIVAVCFRLYGYLNWGGYPIGVIALLYVTCILPFWFRHPLGEVFLPVDHAAAALFTLYICVQTGGRWFLSFAFPVVGASALLFTAVYCLIKHVKGGRLFIFGGFLILLGGFTVLIEFFEHITFGTPMFLWSLYSLAGFGMAGLLLITTGIIPPLRHALERRFFY